MMILQATNMCCKVSVSKPCCGAMYQQIEDYDLYISSSCWNLIRERGAICINTEFVTALSMFQQEVLPTSYMSRAAFNLGPKTSIYQVP
eukprot:4013676-Amphidinium_carterae.1